MNAKGITLEQVVAHMQPATLFDMDGVAIGVGAFITSTAFPGQGQIEEVLDTQPHRFGALLRVIVRGSTHDIRVKLGNVKKVEHIDPKARITQEKYGV